MGDPAGHERTSALNVERAESAAHQAPEQAALSVPTSADEILAARAGRRTAQGPTPYPLVNDGPACSGRISPTCFLDAEQRQTLIAFFWRRSGRVQSNYKDALLAVGIHEMLRKDPTMSWIASLMLDILSVGVAGILAQAVKSLARGAYYEIARIHTQAQLAGDAAPYADLASSALQRVSNEKLTQGVSSVVAAAKEPAKAKLEESLGQSTRDDKAEAQGFIQYLEGAVDAAFQVFDEQTPATADDAELLVLVDALDISKHSTSRYIAIAKEKLQRFRSSGVASIGRKMATAEPFGDVDVPVYERLRDTRVVWHSYVSGHPSDLMYEYQDAHSFPAPPGIGMFPKHPDKLPMQFGARYPRTASPQLGHKVPYEFMQLAVEAHTKAWGGPPETVSIDDTCWSDPAHVAYTHMHRRTKHRATIEGVVQDAMAAQLQKGTHGTTEPVAPQQPIAPGAGDNGPRSATDVWLGRKDEP